RFFFDLKSGKCSAAILGGQECQALMWLDMLMVDVNVSILSRSRLIIFGEPYLLLAGFRFRCITWKYILFPETKNITIICFQRLIRSKTETKGYQPR
ncbi:hypothetical protein HID58_060631, partial [Brassica napus]